MPQPSELINDEESIPMTLALEAYMNQQSLLGFVFFSFLTQRFKKKFNSCFFVVVVCH